MKKLLSLSLVASATILSLNASAQDLSEAIKNVDVSGTVVYRYNDYEPQTGSAAGSTNNYKVATSLKSKVNDDVTFNSRFLVESLGMNTSTTADSSVDVELSEANFTYTGIANASITLGKQGVATPFTVHRDSIGSESTGTGILATYSMGPVTAAAAYFNQTNISVEGSTALNGNNIYAAALMGSFANINADAWFLDVENIADAYTLGLSASYKVGEVELSPAIRYSEQDEDANNDDISTFKAEISAKLGMFDAYFGYGETDKNGGVAIDGNSSATILDPHWRVTLWNQADADAYYVNAGAQVTDQLHVSLRYSDLDIKSGNDASETYVQAFYQMSANFYTMVRFGEYEVEGSEDATSGRLQVGYSF